ncbi:MAG: GIY-YIG nuclease family protein [Verrucomicrobia bacterium]|nr:GIY-YIG nuclease family protein [Verrucomicrobiota bacterium]
MPTCVTYILYSERLARHYVGSSQDVNARLERHNRGGSYWTSRGAPWRIVYLRSFSTSTEAAAMEKRIKKTGIAKSLVVLHETELADGFGRPQARGI